MIETFVFRLFRYSADEMGEAANYCQRKSGTTGAFIFRLFRYSADEVGGAPAGLPYDSE